MANTVVLYAPQLEALAKELVAKTGAASLLSTADLASCGADDQSGSNSVALFWDTFPSASTELDPNTKVLHTALVGKHVVLLLSQDDTTSAFAQLSLVLWLQRFVVPNPTKEHADGKWKDTVADGAFTVASVASLSIVIPWYRYCQMERTSRWTRTDGSKPWDNKKPDGAWLDVPTAQTYAALLSADPPCAPTSDKSDVAVPPVPPKRLLLIDLHDDLKGRPVLERTLRGSGKWKNTDKEYDLPTGTGTFFASAFHTFLQTTYADSVDDMSKVIVVFPDVGAFRRFVEMVKACLRGLRDEQVLFIEKSRVGTEVEQSDCLNYFDAQGAKQQREELPAGSSVLIPDDFTNSGSTLFGAATIVRKHALGPMAVSSFVTHFVAKYDRTVVDKFVAKLYSEGDNKSDLDQFYTTDTIANTTKWLMEEVAKRVDDPKVKVMSTAPVIAEWLKDTTWLNDGA